MALRWRMLSWLCERPTTCSCACVLSGGCEDCLPFVSCEVYFRLYFSVAFCAAGVPAARLHRCVEVGWIRECS